MVGIYGTSCKHSRADDIITDVFMNFAIKLRPRQNSRICSQVNFAYLSLDTVQTKNAKFTNFEEF